MSTIQTAIRRLPPRASRSPSTVWADWGLRITLSRDLAHKFVAVSTPEAREKEQNRVNPIDHWRLLGHFDFAKISRFRRLESIEDTTTPEHEVPWRVFRDLVLLPMIGAMPPDSFVAPLLQEPSAADTEHPFLAIVPVVFAPTVFEDTQSSPDLARSILNVRKILLASELCKVAPGLEFHFFGSLGGADFVVVAMPKDVEELSAANLLIQRVRTLSLAEVMSGEPGAHQNGQAQHGHACAVVSPLVGFQEGSLAKFETQKFQDQERRAHLRIHFRLRVDAGHEHVVIDDLTTKFAARGIRLVAQPEGDAHRVNYDDHAVIGCFNSFADFARAWSQAWFKPHWRRAHLLDSVSYLSLKLPRVSELRDSYMHTDRPWVLANEHEEELAEIKSRIVRFAERNLSRTQQTELIAVFNRFQSCFYRHDWTGIARDFFPFFRELARCLNQPDEGGEWKSFFQVVDAQSDSEEAQARLITNADGIAITADFNEEMAYFLTHISRAIQNRIEHRSLQGDPPSAHTLRSGACKVLTAYTAMIRLCADLSRGTSDLNATGQSPPLAVCLGAGSEGRVVCSELFEDFRVFSERGRSFPGKETDSWRARLLLFDISGKTLLRPEICFVHCLHEYAELSPWMSSPGCLTVRTLVNRWILNEFADCLAHAVAYTAHLGEGPAGESTEAQLQRLRQAACRYRWNAARLVYFCAAHQNGGIARDIDKQGLIDDLGLLSGRSDPFGFAASMLRDLRAWIEDDAEAINHFCERYPRICGIGPISLERGFDKLREAITGSELSLRVDCLEALATEVIADIGMWTMLDYLLGADQPMRSAAERLEDVSKVYCSMLTAAAEARGPKRSRCRVERFILQRWAIQAAAVACGQPWQDRILTTFAEHKPRPMLDLSTAEEYINGLSAAERPLFGKHGLVTSLASLSAYGGNTPAPLFTPLESLGKVETRALDAFRRAWRPRTVSEHGADQIGLVMDLWSLAQSREAMLSPTQNQ